MTQTPLSARTSAPPRVISRAPFSDGRAFGAIMAGQALSTIGSGMTRFGLGIWVFSTTKDAAAYSTLLFFAVLPLGLGSLLAGPLVDRWNRKTVMLLANATASVSTLAIAALYFADMLAVWHLYIALFANGVANAFIFPALESSTPLLVPEDKLDKAAGLTQLLQGVETIVAPALGGLVVGAWGLDALFIVDFATFAASMVALGLSAVPRPDTHADKSVWRAFVFGVRYIRDRPGFLTLMALVTWMMFILPGLGYALVTPLVMTFATEEAAGFVMSAFGVGSIVGGIALAAWGGPGRRMNGIIAATALAGVGTMLVGLRENTWLMAGAFVLVGANFMFVMGLNRVLWQAKAAPDVLGRVFALRVALGVGAQSAGVFAAGLLAKHVFEPAMLSGGALASIAGPWLGTGPGRGMGFMYILLGIALLATAATAWVLPRIRLLEDSLDG